jgi:chlorite dismutase
MPSPEKCTEMDIVLKVHRARIDEMERLVQDINRQLIQIKACAYGAVGYAIATQMGIIEAIKL